MRVLTPAVAVVVAATIAACATAGTGGTSSGGGGMMSGQRPDSSLLAPDKLAEARQLFATGVCARCHGPTGGGGMGGPNLSDRDWLQTSGSYSGIVAIIRSGVTLADIRESSFRQPMPARGGPMNLTDEQVAMLGAYVWSLSNMQQ